MSREPRAESLKNSIEILRLRAEVLRKIRHFFSDKEVLEVETPILSPFAVTDPDVHSIKVADYGYLHTSPEYAMKRLLCKGAPSIFQISHVFRAGELGRYHNPEFTMLEWYRLNFDHIDLMAEVSEVINLILGPGEYQTIPYKKLLGSRYEKLKNDRSELDLAFSLSLEELGTGRFFISDYPADQAVLSRIDPRDPTVSCRFELVVDGVEIANGYWELQDVAEHEERFQKDLERRTNQNAELPEVDQNFMRSLEAGLPDCAGVSVGLDRVLMILAEAHSLDAVMPIGREPHL
jgi:lysyl-tRNA synthetase class 2